MAIMLGAFELNKVGHWCHTNLCIIIITINQVSQPLWAYLPLSTHYLFTMDDNMAYCYLYKISFLLFQSFSIKIPNSFQW